MPAQCGTALAQSWAKMLRNDSISGIPGKGTPPPFTQGFLPLVRRDFKWAYYSLYLSSQQ